MTRSEFRLRVKEFMLADVLADTPNGRTKPGRKYLCFGRTMSAFPRASKRGNRITSVKLYGNSLELYPLMEAVGVISTKTRHGRRRLQRSQVLTCKPTEFFRILKMLARGEH